MTTTPVASHSADNSNWCSELLITALSGFFSAQLSSSKAFDNYLRWLDFSALVWSKNFAINLYNQPHWIHLAFLAFHSYFILLHLLWKSFYWFIRPFKQDSILWQVVQRNLLTLPTFTNLMFLICLVFEQNICIPTTIPHTLFLLLLKFVITHLWHSHSFKLIFCQTSYLIRH